MDHIPLLNFIKVFPWISESFKGSGTTKMVKNMRIKHYPWRFSTQLNWIDQIIEQLLPWGIIWVLDWKPTQRALGNSSACPAHPNTTIPAPREGAARAGWEQRHFPKKSAASKAPSWAADGCCWSAIALQEKSCSSRIIFNGADSS